MRQFGYMRSALAAFFILLVSTSPAAMTVLAASVSPVSAAPQHSSHGSQRHQHLPTQCCDLCVASCMACGAVVASAQPTARGAAISSFIDRLDTAPRIVDAVVWYLRPPPIGPPS